MTARPMTWAELTALIAATWLLVLCLPLVNRWLNRRSVVRAAEHLTRSAAEHLTRSAAEQLLHRLATAAHDLQEPTP